MMARMADEVQIGREAMGDSVVTFTLDGGALARGAFGVWSWRLRLFRLLVRPACRALRCGCRIEMEVGR
jgi:hypothetical protein